MSCLLYKLQARHSLRAFKVLTSPLIKQCHWFPDYKPGPYPKTEEERIAAAKKYRMVPEEYEPYNTEHESYGDYPKIDIVSVDHRDPYHTWDYPNLRRDFLDPVCDKEVFYLPEYKTTIPTKLALWQYCFIFFSMMGLGATTFYLLSKFRLFIPLAEKQYPKEGVTHYTFELKNTVSKSKAEPCATTDP